MNAMGFKLHRQMSKAELAGVIDGAEPPGLLSPRSLLGAPRASPAPAGELRDAAKVLGDPHTRITLRIWGGEAASAETTVLFPASPAAGAGYLLNDADGRLDVSGPVEAEQILALVAPLLPQTRPGAPFFAQLEPTTMAVLAAVIDIACEDARQARIARVLDGRPMPDSLYADLQPVSPIRVAAYLDAWWALSRFDQLLTYAVTLGGEPRPPRQPAIDAALLQLSEARLIATSGSGGIVPAPDLSPLMTAAFGLSAGFQWQRVSKLNDGALSIVEHIVLTCAGGPILDLSVTAAGLVRLARASRDDIVDFLVGELAGAADGAALPQQTAPQAAPARHFCEHCGHPVGAADRFCGECGRELT